VNIDGISRNTVTIYGAINFGAINLLLQKMEQFYGAIIWYHLMAPFYGIVPGFRSSQVQISSAAAVNQRHLTVGPISTLMMGDHLCMDTPSCQPPSSTQPSNLCGTVKCISG